MSLFVLSNLSSQATQVLQLQQDNKSTLVQLQFAPLFRGADALNCTLFCLSLPLNRHKQGVDALNCTLPLAPPTPPLTQPAPTTRTPHPPPPPPPRPVGGAGRRQQRVSTRVAIRASTRARAAASHTGAGYGQYTGPRNKRLVAFRAAYYSLYSAGLFEVQNDEKIRTRV